MTLCILIADQSRARMFISSGNGSELREVEGFVHPRGRQRDGDVMADRPGRVRSTSGGPAVAALPPHANQKEVEAGRFATQLADVLRTAHQRGTFDQLAIVAPPRFLGLMRDSLDEQTTRRLVACVDKELTLLEPRSLPPHLAEVFTAASRAELAAEAGR